jgi:hypothetical protein
MRAEFGPGRGPVWPSLRRDGNLGVMDEPKRLADPDFEPTDEDLIGLSKRAFAHIRAAHEESLRKMREEIAAASKAALERLRATRPGLRTAR